MASTFDLASDASEPAFAHVARAQTALRAGDVEGARCAAMTAVSLPSVNLEVRNALASVLYEVGELGAARAVLDEILARDPHYGDALNNLANILVREGKPRIALEFYARALATDPGRADYLANLGGAHQALGDVAAALDCFDRALACDPGHADARWNRAIARLLTGDLKGGFADYEARWSLPEFAQRTFISPPWRGEPLRGKTILIQSEQGYGDTIQMIRFARVLAAQGARVVLETHAPLVRLMRSVAGIDQVIAHGESLPAVDFHVPIMSLPHLIGLGSIADIPAACPYLSAPSMPQVVLPPREDGVVRVGLVWAGRPTHKNDRNRSLAPHLLAPLAGIANVRLFSLQIGASSGELACFRGLVDLAPQLVDFAATAEAVEALDLVITVDTAVAHLAGALGREAWVLLPFAPDWRWLLARETSPWYPSLRLFRQPRLGDWTSPIADVVERLVMRAPR